MKLRKYKPMVRPDGVRRHIRIPQCQHVDQGKQCGQSVYERGLCYEHFQASLETPVQKDICEHGHTPWYCPTCGLEAKGSATDRESDSER